MALRAQAKKRAGDMTVGRSGGRLVLFIVFIFAMVTTMIGCAPNAAYRTNFDLTGGDPKTAVIETAPEYRLGFVEFDDQGWLWDTKQKSTVEKMVRQEAGIDGDQPTSPKGIVLVAFVHGWKNNASYDDDGVRACRSILTQLSEAEQAQTDHTPRKVVGVYVGWRGLSATVEPFMELSFWGRKDTAHKVGGYGAMTELLVDLEGIQKKSLDSLPKDAPRTELIIIGHSFGGAAVYSALSQIITERFVQNVENGHRLKPLGDQIILLNPAFEASRHYDLNQLARAMKSYPADQRPVLSIFTSKGDWATHYVFPIGRWFSTLFDADRSGFQTAAGRETVGWFKPFLTHNLIYTGLPAGAAEASSQPSAAAHVATAQGSSAPSQAAQFSALQQRVQNVKRQREKWHPNAAVAQTYTFDETKLEPVEGFQPGDPFLIVSVDEKIMADHTDITNANLIKFLGEYIQFCQADPLDRTKS
jgi:hypothetical protein